jgi:hypothetical protein
VAGNFHPVLKSGRFGGDNGGLDCGGMGGRGGVLGEITMPGWESDSRCSLGGDFGGDLGGGDMRLSELRPSLDRETLGESERVFGVFLRLCVLGRTGVCFVGPCWGGGGDPGGNDPMELRFDQLGREEFQFLSRSYSITSSTEALLLCERAGDAAREEEEEVIESYRGRDPNEGRVG